MKKSLIRICAGIVLSGILMAALVFFWVYSMMPSENDRALLKATLPTDIPYIANKKVEPRGKVLAVLTSWDQFGQTGKKTGYELTEISRAYYVLAANGFEVDIASPKGGEPPMVLDPEDLAEFDYAFLNDEAAMEKVKNSLPLDQVYMENYQAVFFVGGKGAMFDFPGNSKIQELVLQAWSTGKVIGAVCHGPAALVDVKMTSGTYFLQGKKLASFTNEEELFIIPEATTIFPFLLQTKLEEQKANFQEGKRYLPNVIKDGLLITGQNPWSTWEFAETLVEGMGFIPQIREKTSEENALTVLATFHDQGISAAKRIHKDFQSQGKPVDKGLLAMHWMVSIMEAKLINSFGILWLLST